jgi:heme/copper-type cytochrome/quinol oxidase subunit 2
MQSIMRRTAIAVATAIVMGLATAAVASAHDTACEVRLRESPVEVAVLPVGWAWDFFTVEPYGAPSFQASIDAGGFAVELELSCASDPAGLFARIEELREVAGNDKLGVIEIGDEAIATREFLDFPTIRWRHGDIVGQLRAYDEVDFGDMEAFAQAVDELLP